MSKLMLSILGGVAEFERSIIRERQREGISVAKAKGVYRGRKHALTSEQVAQIRQRAAAHEQKAALAREFGISRETLYQALRPDYTS
jgi:DNA invertase Pin-like site-specific DNA recombinase